MSVFDIDADEKREMWRHGRKPMKPADYIDLAGIVLQVRVTCSSVGKIAGYRLATANSTLTERSSRK